MNAVQQAVVSMGGVRRTTIVLLVVSAVVLVAWDVAAAWYTQSSQPTISNVLREWNYNCGWLVALVSGAVWLHIFCVPLLPHIWTGL
jgi:hypothetical protein